MSAVPKPLPLRFRPMVEADLESVLAIETAAYPFPWTRGNFEDCLKSGYICRVAEADGIIVGYNVLMPGVDEGHVLNCCVSPKWQGQGFGNQLMLDLIERAHHYRMGCLFLEVRPSNRKAIKLYERLGFEAVGLRRHYYPAHDGREDALVMRMIL